MSTLREDRLRQLGGMAGVETVALLEASLGRIWQHNKDRTFVMLTSWRADKDLAANKASLKKLKQKIRGAGYGFLPLDGVGQETKSGKTTSVSEPSLLVLSNETGDDPKLAQLARKWAKAYNQDYIFVHTIKDGEPYGAVVNVKSGKHEVFKKFVPGQMGAFYSKLRSGGTFTYEHVGVKYDDPPKNWIHGMGRESGGEIFTQGNCETLEEWRAEMTAILGGR